MATTGFFEQTKDLSNLFFVSMSSKISGFKVLSFADGIIEIEPSSTYSIEDVLDEVMGFLESGSNFFNEVLQAFHCDQNSVFKGIRFSHSGITIIVTVDTTNKYKLLSDYWQRRYNIVSNKYNLAMLSLIEKTKGQYADKK